MIRRSWICEAVIMVGGFAALAVGLPSGVEAQAAADPAVVTCDSVLTREEALAIVGDGYAGPAVDEPRPGFTRCEWQGEDTNFGFTFASERTLKDDMSTAEEAFEHEVSAVESAQHRRELIPGIGLQAAVVVLEGDAILVAVRRPDGVARMLTYKVNREKTIALARAIAAP